MFRVKQPLAVTLLCIIGFVVFHPKPGYADDSIRVGVFDVDASPPVGSPLAYDPMKGLQQPLSCRGVVIVGDEKPIVLLAIDWIGVSNGGQNAFKDAIAQALKTDTNRVVVHALHQHDAPRCDFSASDMLKEFGLDNAGFNTRHARKVIADAALSAKEALENAQTVTHVGTGSSDVEKVASNRRILGKDGKVSVTRYTATKDPKVRAMPIGTIDPELKLLAFYNGESPIALLTYYATHPQSYYRTGMANPDFPGLARNAIESELEVPVIHFNGAGGNIGAGKWNDGATENRQVLADRVADGMRRAWDSVKKSNIDASQLSWRIEPVKLPVAAHLDEHELLTIIGDESAPNDNRWYAAKNLAWLRRCQQDQSIDIACLTLADNRVLHLPGELFVEYQLAAQKMRPDLFICMAAYGDYAPGYIGTEIAYDQGGYETSQRATNVAPRVEHVLMQAMEKLLEK